MRHVPWHVKGVRPEVREVARDVARRSGLSVGAWLNSLIVDAAARQGRSADDYWKPVPRDPATRSQTVHVDNAALAAIRKDIDELKRQMQRPQVDPAVFEQRLHDVGSRIDALQSSVRHDDVVETLSGKFAEFHGTLNAAALPAEEIAKIWRQDLGAISATLRNAMPTEVLAALEREVRALGERLEAHQKTEAATAATADIEQALAGIRDRLQALTPAEELAELSDAVKLLSRKTDSIATENSAPEKMKQLEQAIGALQGLVAQVASREAVAALSQDIKALGDSIDRSYQPAVDAEFMNTLERRLAEIAEAVGRCHPLEDAPVPANFDAILKALTDRLEGIQMQVAASAADAISGPAESIRRDVASLKEIQTSVDQRTQDTFEAVYGTIEQVVDRLATIEDGLRNGGVAPPGNRTSDSPEWSSNSAAARLRFMSAMVAEAPTLVPSATPLAERAAPVPSFESSGTRDLGVQAPSGVLSDHPSAAAARLRHSAASGTAADAPLEPGSGAHRVRVVADAINRIAASEAVNGASKPAETATPVRANFVAAARRAARAVAGDHQGMPAARFERAARNDRLSLPAGSLSGVLRPRIRSVAIGAAVIIVVLGALRLGIELFHDSGGMESAQPITGMDDAVQPGGAPPVSPPEPPRSDRPSTRRGANIEPPTAVAPFNANTLPDETILGQTPRSGVLPDEVAPAAIPRPLVALPPAANLAMTAAMPDMVASTPIRNAQPQGAIVRGAALQSALPATIPTRDLAEMPLPPSIGGKALIAAAAAGDPGASYEIAVRFAQGRNAPQDLAMAAAWFQRAARGGVALAQFRLGSMYEKGLGIQKDVAEARRLYLAAADKGNAKAMHNLAVLYAEGFDGKPDYAVALQWFHRAALHGIVDSQYNLAIMYARGVGVERNFAESYKWFALAAKGGDKDAARKRDEVATRLDQKQLESARLNVESFKAEPQPEDATAARAPAGGWDHVVAVATTKTKAAR